jgi:hypothetical protein
MASNAIAVFLFERCRDRTCSRSGPGLYSMPVGERAVHNDEVRSWGKRSVCVPVTAALLVPALAAPVVAAPA